MSAAMVQSNAGAMIRPAEGRDVDASIIDRVIVAGDLSRLTPQERVSYYVNVCRSVGLNPLTKPFEYIQLNGKLTLYSTKNCTDQLRAIHGVSVASLRRETVDGIHVVTATVKNASGRCDEDIGAVNIKGLAGENMANALMKATTKAKRRATLSICGLSFVDESELETIADAKHVTFDQEGVIVDGPGIVRPPPVARPTIDGGKLMASYFDKIDKAAAAGALNRVAAGAQKALADGIITQDQRDRVAVAVAARRAELAARETERGELAMAECQGPANGSPSLAADIHPDTGEEVPQ